jgi:hypothetical protein
MRMLEAPFARCNLRFPAGLHTDFARFRASNPVHFGSAVHARAGGML